MSAIDTVAMKVAGVLGGMGPEATVDFMAKVIAATPAGTDQEHVRMIVDHNPQIPSRQVDTPEQRAVVMAALADMALNVEAAGADFIVMPCNTAHAFLDVVQQKLKIPFISIVHETVHAVTRGTPGAKTAGLLATNACIRAGLYQSAGDDASLEMLLPTTEDQASLMQLVFRIKSGDRGQPVADGMRRIANGLVERGAAVVIAGCTEIPLVLSAAQIAAPLLSSTDVLAERTVAYCRGSMSLPG